jgi:hypothetical protein
LLCAQEAPRTSCVVPRANAARAQHSSRALEQKLSSAPHKTRRTRHRTRTPHGTRLRAPCDTRLLQLRVVVSPTVRHSEATAEAGCRAARVRGIEILCWPYCGAQAAAG